MFAFGEAFTIVTRVRGRSADGNAAWTDGALTAVTGAFAPAGASELVQGQDTVLSQPAVYLAAGSPVPAVTDQMIVRGVRYEVDGVPGVYVNPFTGAAPGPVVKLQRVTG